MPCTVESASLEPKYGNKFVAGGEDMWVRVFDFHTGQEIGMCLEQLLSYFAHLLTTRYQMVCYVMLWPFWQGH